MRASTQLTNKLFRESPTSCASLRSVRPHNRIPNCLLCRSSLQKRQFAEYSKPTENSRSLSNNEPLSQEKRPVDQSQQEYVSTELPSTAEGQRSAFNQRFSHLMDNMQGNIFIASQRINDLTGYSGIEALKSRIVELENRVENAQEAVRSSRLTYKTTVADRAATQREVTTLLARKDSWTPTDLERFTSLYRMDHSNEQAVQEAATKLADAEKEAETAAGKLSSSILSRYHEEQIWSDKIRRMSTWGTWGLMGVNVLLFLVFQFGFEPWRRRRLVHGFEEKVREALEKEKEAQAGLNEDLEHLPLDELVTAKLQDLGPQADIVEPSSPDMDTVPAHVEETRPDPDAVSKEHDTPQIIKLSQLEAWKVAVQDLFSTRLIQVRKQDVTVIALEGAATGAAIVAVMAALLRSP